MLKFFKKLLIIIFIGIIFYYSFSYADINEVEDNEDRANIQSIIQETSASSFELPSINSRAAVVIDRTSNTILYGKNENEIKKMASTTKIMTSLVVIENSNLSDIVTVSKKAAGTGGSRLGIKTDDKISVNDLLYGLMLCSGNDAAVALAEYVGGSVEEFAKLMNNKADELGLNQTHFVTPHGLDADEHYTTAYELAILANYALKNDTFAKIVGTKNTTILINNQSKSLTNTNELLGYLNGVYGVKTGFTNGANRCLVTSCKRDNLDIICVVLGADTKKFRTQDSIKLIEYTFSNFTTIDIQKIINDKFEYWKNNEFNININKGTTSKIDLKLDDLPNNNIAISKKQVNNITINIDIKSDFNAPIHLNEYIGNLNVLIGDKILCSSKIISNTEVPKKRINNYISIFFQNYYSIILGRDL